MVRGVTSVGRLIEDYGDASRHCRGDGVTQKTGRKDYGKILLFIAEILVAWSAAGNVGKGECAGYLLVPSICISSTGYAWQYKSC